MLKFRISHTNGQDIFNSKCASTFIWAFVRVCAVICVSDGVNEEV